MLALGHGAFHLRGTPRPTVTCWAVQTGRCEMIPNEPSKSPWVAACGAERTVLELRLLRSKKYLGVELLGSESLHAL